MNERIFMTGGSGFIGSHFHEKISNDQIINFDKKDPFDFQKSIFCKGDIREFDSIDKALTKYPCQVILSLAAEHVDFGVTDEGYFKTNEYGTELICKAATKHNIKKIIFYSSVAVYGDEQLPSNEEIVPEPTRVYGASKLAGEQVLKKWCAEDNTRSVLIIRPAVVYGERSVANVYRLIEQILKGRYFHVGKGDNIKSIAYVANLVEGTLFLADRMQEGKFEIYNYVDDPQMTSKEIAEQIYSILGKKSPMSLPYWLMYTLGLPFDLIIKLTGIDLPISTDRIKKFKTMSHHKSEKLYSTGFKAELSNEQGLKKMVDWQKTNT